MPGLPRLPNFRLRAACILNFFPSNPQRIYILSVLFSGNSYTNGAKVMAIRMLFSPEREILQSCLEVRGPFCKYKRLNWEGVRN